MKHNVNSIKVILITFSIFITLLSSAQNDKIVTLTTNGQGKTSEEAKNNALRSAIEQAFGAFVSSNTSVVNDNLIKDEIVSVSNGNISKYDILSEKTLPDNTWLVSVKADISPQNLVKFCESKGIKVDFKGALFAANVKIMELNKQNELKTIKNCFDVACDILPKSYDYSLEVSEPKSSPGGKWISDITVKAKLNDNIKIITDLISSNLEALSIPDDQINKYKELNIETYELQVMFFKPKKTDEKNKKDKNRKEKAENNLTSKLEDITFKKYNFRNRQTIESLEYFFGEILYSHSLYFKINNGIETQKGFDLQCQEQGNIDDRQIKYSKNLTFKTAQTNYLKKTLTNYIEITDPVGFTTQFCVKSVKSDFLGYNYTAKLMDRGISGFGSYRTFLNSMGYTETPYQSTHLINLYSLQKDEPYFKIFLVNTLSTEDITKITQYTVEPIIQKNCDK